MTNKHICADGLCIEEETLAYENTEEERVWLCKKHKGDYVRYETKEDILDQYFPKGDKRRKDALVILAKSYIEGRKDTINKLSKSFNIHPRKTTSAKTRNAL